MIQARATSVTTMITARIKKAAKVGSAIVSFLFSASIIIALVIFIWAFIKEYNNDSIRIEPLQAAEKLVAMGYTPQVLAARLEAVMLDRRKTSKSTAERATSERVGTKADFIIPTAGVSLKVLAAYTRDLMGNPFPSISGELTVEGKTDSEKVHMRVRLNGARISSCTWTLRGNGIDRLMETCVVDVMKHTEPVVIAGYYYEMELEKAKEIIVKILATKPSAKNKSGVINILGNVFFKEKNLDAAIEQYILAIDIDPKNANAYNNLGNALFKNKDPDGAIEKYRDAIRIDPDYVYAYNGWGNTLYFNKDFDGAIGKYRDAIRIDPEFANAYLNWGNALEEKGALNGAIEKFLQAMELDKYENLKGHIEVLKRKRLDKADPPK